MTDGEFDALVARLETPARRDPRKYQLKVLALARLGWWARGLYEPWLLSNRGQTPNDKTGV